jgi:hypothetical protein
MNGENEIELLEKFVLNNPELDALENLLSQFNIFETLDIVNAEIRHSNVLSWLLNPNANHGLGDFFTKQFLKYLISKNKDYLDSKVVIENWRREYNQFRPHSSLGYRPPAPETFEPGILTLGVVQ